MGDSAASVPGETGDTRFDRVLLAPVVQDRPAAGPGSSPVAWAPADACTLPTAEQPLRVAEFDALFATALRGMDRPVPTWLRLSLDARAEVEARTRDLTARESSCCSFFDFQLTATEGGLTLDVRVPEARVGVLDGLARRADAARTATGRVRGRSRELPDPVHRVALTTAQQPAPGSAR